MARPAKPWYRQEKDSWYATIGGRKVSLGVKGNRNRRQAVEAWHILTTAAKEEAAKPKPEATVSEVVTGFMTDVEARMNDGKAKPNTVRVYRTYLTSFADAYGKHQTVTLTPTVAEAFCRRPEWSSSTRCTILSMLTACFRWAERAGIIDRNPLVGMKKPKLSSRGEQALLTTDEAQALLFHASPAFRLFLTVLWSCGCRPGEAAAFTAENFDADAGLVRLADHKTAHKGFRRTIYLTPEAVALLASQREKHPSGALLRNGKGTAWTGNTIVRAMLRLRQRAGVPHAIAYGFRHTFATDALANGVPDAQVAELLGHQGTAMLHKHYSHLGAKAQTLRNALAGVR